MIPSTGDKWTSTMNDSLKVTTTYSVPLSFLRAIGPHIRGVS
jgi:hypothetical protein